MSPTGQELKDCPVLSWEAHKMRTRAVAGDVTAGPDRRMTVLQPTSQILTSFLTEVQRRH